MKEPRHDTRQREAQVVSLRVAGHTFDQIAEQTGLSSGSTVHRVYRRALDRTVSDQVATLRDLENRRLDEMWAEWWPYRQRYEITKLLLRLMDQRAKLNGLYAPRKLQVSTPELDEQIRAELLALGVGADQVGLP